MPIYRESQPLRGNPIWHSEAVVDGFSIHMGEHLQAREPTLAVALIDRYLDRIPVAPAFKHDTFTVIPRSRHGDCHDLNNALDAVRFADFAIIGFQDFDFDRPDLTMTEPVIYPRHLFLSGDDIRRRGHFVKSEVQQLRFGATFVAFLARTEWREREQK